MAGLLEVAFDGGIQGGTVLHCIAEGVCVTETSVGDRPFAMLEDTNPCCMYRPRLVIFLLELKSSKYPQS